MNEYDIYIGISNKDERVLGSAMAQYEALFYTVSKHLLAEYGTDEDIADCITDTWYYIWNNIENWDETKYSFKNWCMLILKCRVLNRRKRNARIYKNEHSQEEHPQYIDGVEDMFISSENYKEIYNIISRLKSPKKDIMIMRYFKGKGIEEIAKEFNVSSKKIYYYLYESKKFLKKHLEKGSSQYET